MTNFSVLTWNVQGRRLMSDTPFTNIMPFLETRPAEIMCLQEIPNAHRKLSLLKYVGQYHVAVPRHNDNDTNQEHNHTVILSKYPIIKSGEINYKNLKLKGFRGQPIEKSTWADLEMNGNILRIYNCHLNLRGFGIKERQVQLKKVLDHAQKAKSPVIICGDMNTVIPRVGISRRLLQYFHKIDNSSFTYDDEVCLIDERFVFPKIAEKVGFNEVTEINQTTWCVPKLKWELFKLKLDWFMIRDLTAQKVEYGPYISDHRPVYVECST